MLLHNYWQIVLGSKVKVKVLRVLCRYPTKKFTIREISRLCHSTHTPVIKTIPHLQQMNILHIEKHGTANIITLNTKSVLVPVLQQMFTTEYETKKNLIKRLAQIIPSVKMVALFGSIAKALESVDSDIDILIVAENKKEIMSKIDERRNKIITEFGNLLSPLILTELEFKRKKNTPFAKDLIKNYEIIQGEDLIKKWWLQR